MKQLSRRSLVASLASLAPLACLGPGSREAGTTPQATSVLLERESLKVYAHWMRTERMAPEAYLRDAGLPLDDAVAIRRHIVRDFENGNIYVYNGLIASKCEMAILACYGQKLGAQLS